MRREIRAVALVILLFGTLFILLKTNTVESAPRTIIVPDDYSTIGGALAAANSGDTILIKSGSYGEAGLVVNKTLHIVGQNRYTAIVDGSGQQTSVFTITSAVNVTLENLTIRNSWSASIFVGGGSFANISDNIIQGSIGKGIYLYQTSNCTVAENNISNCSMAVSADDCSSIKITRNNISDFKSYSLNFLVSDDVRVYYNNIFGTNAHFSGSQITCDNGYPSGGNFWSGYSGLDSDGDKIGDTPYAPDPGSPGIVDRFPLMTDFSCIHDLEMNNIEIGAPAFNRGTIVSVELIVKDTGHFTETFNLSVYANSTKIGEVSGGPLLRDDSMAMTLIWNTSMFLGGDYVLSAEVDPVSGETYITNNEYVYGVVTIYDIQVVQFSSCNQAGEPLLYFQRGTIAYFKITIDTLGAPSPTVFALNLYDPLLYPIGLSSFKGPIPMGNTTFILGVPIPLWATMGTGTAYANFFTDWPHQGGFSISFEASTAFFIAQEAGAGSPLQITEYKLSNPSSSSSSGYNVESGSSGDLSLSVATNQTTFCPTQGIGITGHLAYDDAPLSGRLVSMEIRNPNGDTIVARAVATHDSGDFKLALRLPANTLIGNYTLSVCFSRIGQTVTADSMFEIVTLLGDLNRDSTVDIFDIVIVALQFGRPPPPITDPRADVNKDGTIDIFDIAIVAIHFGEKV